MASKKQETFEPFPDNPGGRLQRIVELVRQQPENENSLIAWAKVLDIPERDLPRLMSTIFRIPNLIDETRDQLRAIDDIAHDRYLAWEPVVREPFKTYRKLDLPIAHFRSKFSESIVTALLPICADQIKLHEPVIDERRRQGLLRRVRKLIAEIQKLPVEDLDVQLRTFILKHLMIVEQSLVDYQLNGIRSLIDGREELLGRAAVRKETVKRASETAIWPKVRNIIVVYVLATSAATQSIELIESGRDLLRLTNDNSVPETSDSVGGEADQSGDVKLS